MDVLKKTTCALREACCVMCILSVPHDLRCQRVGPASSTAPPAAFHIRPSERQHHVGPTVPFHSHSAPRKNNYIILQTEAPPKPRPSTSVRPGLHDNPLICPISLSSCSQLPLHASSPHPLTRGDNRASLTPWQLRPPTMTGPN